MGKRFTVASHVYHDSMTLAELGDTQGNSFSKERNVKQTATTIYRLRAQR
jgi:hypothetical protein